MQAKMTYVDMVEQACNSNPGKFCSRAMIKSYMTSVFRNYRFGLS